MVHALASSFAPEPGYLNTASIGVPPLAAQGVSAELVSRWGRGRLEAAEFDADVERCRRSWASLAGVEPASVAAGSTVAQFVGLVAASLPDGARVLVAEGEFTSVVFPFLAHASRGVTVVERPLESLVDERDEADLIAVSSVQSADGRTVDVAALRRTADRIGARLLLDITQSCGWLPLDCSDVDFVVCAAYKWLCAPRGVAFLAVRPDALDTVRPLAANWYAGEDRWASVYGTPLRLATSARRFDLSPAWFSWRVGAESLQLFAAADVRTIHEHNVGLADRFLQRLGHVPRGSAIVSIDHDASADQLAAAGVRVSLRAGRLRFSFHVYNDDDDLDLVVKTLAPDG